MTISRRGVMGGAVASMLLPRASHAQAKIYGRIAYVQDGNILQWSPDGITELKRDGAAMSPSWQPGSDMLMYVRDGGSYSNLISLDTATGRTKRLTDSESRYQRGSQDYVYDSDWINDVFWSESGILVFSSNAAPSAGELNLWVLDYDEEYTYQAANDNDQPGHIEKATVDAGGSTAVYTILGEDMRSSSIGLRDLDTGATWYVMGSDSYDGAISPNGRWVVGCRRDEEGNNDLWLWHRESERLTQLTHGEQTSNPTWDPLGEAIAWLTYTGDGFSLRAAYLDFTDEEPVFAGDPTVLIPRADIDAGSRPSWNSAT
ncbi:MAG: hypothetical protein M9953_05100 [Thermomicrobiales bacterium]|nr:hypothetical protein [Thermomicrobiales bacterium]